MTNRSLTMMDANCYEVFWHDEDDVPHRLCVADTTPGLTLAEITHLVQEWLDARGCGVVVIIEDRGAGMAILPGAESAGRDRLDREAILAHFARRKEVGHYRATAHDRKKLDRLEVLGYTQAEVLAAIDRAFGTRPPDEPSIRMFSYCATVALATPPRRSTAPGQEGAAP
jgi:hypothetical protein